MRDRSRLQVVPARLLGQPLLEGFGTETAVIAQPDASGPASVLRGGTGALESAAATENRRAVVHGLMRQTTIAHGRFSPWEGCKESRSTLQNTIWVTFVSE